MTTLSVEDASTIDRVIGEITKDVTKAATEGALAAVYWNLRDHATSYREARAFKLSYENWRNNRDAPRAYEKHAIHEFYARGLEAAAREVAQMLGKPENEIERDIPSEEVKP